MFIRGFMSLRGRMKEYSRSKEDYREKIILKYKKYLMKEINFIYWHQGCLWDWAENTDYVLCNGDSDLLPPLVKKDEIRFEYNQWNQERSKNSCTIFAAIGMLSDLINYEFSLDQIKEVDELSYERGRIRGNGWYVQSAVKLVADRYNESKLSETYWKVAYYRLSKLDNEIIEDVLDKLYTIDWNHWLNSEYNKDKADWMIDGTEFGRITNWHSVDIIKKEGQRSVKNSYKGTKGNIYWLKNKLSAITNFWSNFYVYTLVGDNLERIKKLNEIKAKIVNWMGINSELWHLSNSELHKNKLHDMNNFFRDWLSYIDGELKSLV